MPNALTNIHIVLGMKGDNLLDQTEWMHWHAPVGLRNICLPEDKVHCNFKYILHTFHPSSGVLRWVQFRKYWTGPPFTMETHTSNLFHTYLFSYNLILWQDLWHPYEASDHGWMSSLFTYLWQKHAYLSSLTYSKPGLPQFTWNPQISVLSVDGFPLSIKHLQRSLHSVTEEMDANSPCPSISQMWWCI